jgi:hypothetical protein
MDTSEDADVSMDSSDVGACSSDVPEYAADTMPYERAMQIAQESTRHLPPDFEALKPSEIRVQDVVCLETNFFIDDKKGVGGIKENSMLHRILNELSLRQLVNINWDGLTRIVLCSETHNGNFLIGFLPTHVRCARDFLLGMYVRGNGTPQLLDEVEGYDTETLIRLMKTLNFEQMCIERILACTTDDTTPRGLIVRRVIAAILDTTFCTTFRDALDEIASNDRAASAPPIVVEEIDIVEVEKMIYEESPRIYDLAKKADTMFDAHGIILTPSNVSGLLETHIASVGRCLMFMTHDDRARGMKAIKLLTQLHDLYSDEACQETKRRRQNV